MDVSQVKQDIESPFNWGPTYKGEKSDEFARHLSAKDDHVDAYEPKEKVRAKDRDERIEDDDPVDTADEDTDRRDATSSDAPVKPAEAAPILAALAQTGIDPKTTSVQTAAVQTVAGGIDPLATKTAAGGALGQPSTAATDTAGTQGKVTGLENAANNAEPSASAKATAAISENIQKQNAAAVDPKAASAVTAATTVASAAASTAQKTTSASTDGNSAVTATDKAKSANGIATTQTNAATPEDESASTVKAQPGTNPLEKMRSDEMAKMSEKEVLTSTISELLAKGKGKISTTAAAAKTGAGAQGSMVSGNNAMVASTPIPVTSTPVKTDTAIGMVTQSALQAEMPILVPNGDLGTSLLMPQQPVEANLATSTTVPGGGIEQTSPNSASQASTAGRAMAQAGSPAEQVATQITTAAKDGANQIKVQLHPADLGRVDIKLELGHDGRIMAVISADNADSLDLLQQDSKQLEKALQDAGFDTGSDSLSFSLNQGDEQDNQEKGSPNGTSTADVQIEEDITLDPAFAANTNSASSGLDIQV